MPRHDAASAASEQNQRQSATVAGNGRRFNFAHMDSKKRKPSPAAQMLQFGGTHRPNSDVLKERIADRTARQANDDRSEIEKMLGVPPRSQSALANKLPGKP